MSYPLFFAESLQLSEAGDSLLACFDSDELHHMKVLRINPGERIRVSCDGAMYEGCVEQISNSCTSCSSVVLIPQADLPKISLFQGISKGERMDLLIRMVSELGIPELVPFSSERCIVRFEDQKKADAKHKRWESIAHSAAKQAGLSRAMKIQPARSFQQVLQMAAEYDICICAWEEAVGLSLHQALSQAPADARLALIIGPEGGLSAAEVEALRTQASAQVITLGETILRTETAGVVAAALASYELGGLGNSR